MNRNILVNRSREKPVDRSRRRITMVLYAIMIGLGAVWLVRGALHHWNPWAGDSAVVHSRQTIGRGGPESAVVHLMDRSVGIGFVDVENAGFYGFSNPFAEEYEPRTEFFKNISQFAALGQRNLRHTPRGWPSRGDISSWYGRRVSPFHGRRRFHFGVDIANDPGTPIWATADGTVRYAGWRGRYGQLVEVDHGYGYVTYYGHAIHITVKLGDRVRRGQIIAYMGSTGSSTGSHIHYEVWRNGRRINPLRYLSLPPTTDMAKAGRRSGTRL